MPTSPLIRRLVFGAVALGLSTAPGLTDTRAVDTVSTLSLGGAGAPTWTLTTVRRADGTVQSTSRSTLGSRYGDGFDVGRVAAGGSAGPYGLAWTSARSGTAWRGGWVTGQATSERPGGASTSTWISTSSGAPWSGGVASSTVTTVHSGVGAHDADAFFRTTERFVLTGWVGFRGFAPFAAPLRFAVRYPVGRTYLDRESAVVLTPRVGTVAPVVVSTSLPRIGRMPVYRAGRVLFSDPFVAVRVKHRLR